jgi:hypothetical protein
MKNKLQHIILSLLLLGSATLVNAQEAEVSVPEAVEQLQSDVKQINN